MHKTDKTIFQDKNVLLLQGPVGPFFAHLAQHLKEQGAKVYKINFNAGDCFFYRSGAITYRENIEAWPAWIENVLRQHHIDIIFLYGDCRPIHRIAKEKATQYNIKIAVFEEGYIRPNYITLESEGVNANSHVLDDFDSTKKNDLFILNEEQKIRQAYWWMVWYGFGYFTISSLGKFLFKKNVHHRSFSVFEGLIWLRSAWRKYWYKRQEAGIEHQLTTSLSKRYFLIPLQVFSDSQVTDHSEYKTVEHFIGHIISSFAKSAMKDVFLVFKHHPMDRGYVSYSKTINKLASQANIKERVIYIHDQHLPSLLTHSIGVVVINSSVGISALHHNIPTLVCGRAFYNIPGLTYQESLDSFWQGAFNTSVDQDLYKKFINHLIAKTQLNGSFYKGFKQDNAFAGLIFQKYNQFFSEL